VAPWPGHAGRNQPPAPGPHPVTTQSRGRVVRVSRGQAGTSNPTRTGTSRPQPPIAGLRGVSRASRDQPTTRTGTTRCNHQSRGLRIAGAWTPPVAAPGKPVRTNHPHRNNTPQPPIAGVPGSPGRGRPQWRPRGPGASRYEPTTRTGTTRRNHQSRGFRGARPPGQIRRSTAKLIEDQRAVRADPANKHGWLVISDG
jgi:hypothetical protein